MGQIKNIKLHIVTDIKKPVIVMVENSTVGGGGAAAAVTSAAKAAAVAEQKIVTFASNVGLQAAELWANYKYYIIGGGGGAIVLFIIICCCCIRCCRKKKKKKNVETENIPVHDISGYAYAFVVAKILPFHQDEETEYKTKPVRAGFWPAYGDLLSFVI